MKHFKFINYHVIESLDDAIFLEKKYPIIFLGLIDEIKWYMENEDTKLPIIIGVRNLRGNYYIIDTDDLDMYGEDLAYTVKLLLGDRTLEQFIKEKGV